MKYWLPLVLAGLLAACAITPEQRARRAAEQKRYEQQLQVSLAARCDQETAEIMARQFSGDTGATAKERQAFRLKYIDKFNDKMFQSCYKMAWQSYIYQRRLEQAERMNDYYDDWGWWGWPRPFPYRHYRY